MLWRRRASLTVPREPKPLPIDCAEHGPSVDSVLCQHLADLSGPPLGFVENSSDPNDLQAWRRQCEKMFKAEGGMTKAFVKFNDFVVKCAGCYGDAKAHHSTRKR